MPRASTILAVIAGLAHGFLWSVICGLAGLAIVYACVSAGFILQGADRKTLVTYSGLGLLVAAILGAIYGFREGYILNRGADDQFRCNQPETK
jgi:hypothetical protein